MKIIGCDVAKDFIILHDGKSHFYITDNDLDLVKDLVKDAIVVLEQTGAYGIRWAYIFSDFGAEVYIADGKEFKAFRHGRTRKKTDWIDAFYLRKFFLNKAKRKYCRPFEPIVHSLRALIRQHIRNDKDITKYTNRLLQYLAVIFPYEQYYKLGKRKLIKVLDEIEKKLKTSPHFLSELALMELNKLKVALSEQEKLEKSIKTIARNHPDYEILKSFPYFGDILIATLLAYYWDIRRFKNVDAFIGYVLMGANFQQSGKSLRETKTDKTRTEVKGKFFNLFKSAHIRDRKGYSHPFYPLVENVKQLASGGHNLKKRYIKFLSRIFELVYYALKYRMPYHEVLRFKLREIEKNIKRLKSYSELDKTKAYELHRLVENFETYRKMYLLASECKDISDPEESFKRLGAERQDYFRSKQNKKEVSEHEDINKEEISKRITADFKGERELGYSSLQTGQNTGLSELPDTDKSKGRIQDKVKELRDLLPEEEKIQVSDERKRRRD